MNCKKNSLKSNSMIILIFSLICVLCVALYNNSRLHSVAIDLKFDKVVNIHNILMRYMEEKNIKIKPGTPKYLKYLEKIERSRYTNSMQDLKKNPRYEDIVTYATFYLVSMEGRDGSILNQIGIYDPIPDEIENKTIKELREESAVKEKEQEKMAIEANAIH